MRMRGWLAIGAWGLAGAIGVAAGCQSVSGLSMDDAGADGASEASGPDATSPAEDAGGDATVGPGPGKDAGPPSTDASSDPDGTSSVDATIVFDGSSPCGTAHTLCDDFDQHDADSPTFEPWSGTLLNGGASWQLGSAQVASPPSSYAIDWPAVADGGAAVANLEWYQAGTFTMASCAFDAYFASPSPNASVMRIHAHGTNPQFQDYESDLRIHDGNGFLYRGSSPTLIGAVPTDQWLHVTYVYDHANSTTTIGFGNFKPKFTIVGEGPMDAYDFHFGVASYGAASSASAVYLDNFVCDVTP